MITTPLSDPAIAPFAALCVVVIMFVMFARESYPTEVVALTGVSVLLATGILPTDQMLDVFTKHQTHGTFLEKFIQMVMNRKGIDETFVRCL